MCNGFIARQNRLEKAAKHFRQAIVLKPDMAGALNSLARILAVSKDVGVRSPAEAVGYAERACRVTENNNPDTLATLALAYMAADRISDAQQAAGVAIKKAKKAGRDDIAAFVQKHVKARLRPLDIR